MKKYKVIYLEWADAIASGPHWYYEDELKEWIDDSEYWIKECGFVIKETKKYILFAGQIKPEDKFTREQYGHLQKIPKTWIRKRKTLKI